MHGGDAVRELVGAHAAPYFVVSDAFPGDLLPVPESVHLRSWPVDRRKRIKQAHWLRRDAFQSLQSGGDVCGESFVFRDPVVCHPRIRNTLDRLINTSVDEGSLFTSDEFVLGPSAHGAGDGDYLSVYVRVRAEFAATLLDLFAKVAQVGFGADVSAGLGQFDLLAPELEPACWLDDVHQPNGVVSLSTFQPGAGDPTDGVWRAFVKYGKVAPDFGLENPFKRPMLMLRAGACFRARQIPGYLGRSIPMDELLAPRERQCLRETGVEIFHLAYGLAVPATFSEEF
jgi:CRISPR-associated protein Csm4